MIHSKGNRFFLIIASWIGILFLFIDCSPSIIKDKQPEIDSIATKWVPDQREGICSVTLVSEGKRTILLRGETTVPQAKQDIIKTLSKPGIVLIDSLIILPDTLNVDKYQGLVTLSVINLRKHPDHRSELVSQAILGTPVLILKDENSWLLIQTPDKYIAWTEKLSVQLMSAAEMDVWKKSQRVIYIENSGWIYNSTDEKGIVGDVVAGSILIKGKESNGYTQVLLPDGREGFINSKKLTDFLNWKTEICCSEERIGSCSLKLLGLPYLWGGSSSKAVDCSGFVHLVYFMNGIILSRDASLQAQHGFPVSLSNKFEQLKKGDLLFFGTKENSRLHVTHVAIYLGNEEYINSSGRVMINSLDSASTNYIDYRETSLLAARRIIGVDNDPGIVSVDKHPWY
jgi:gamma-D-glutamyl-L-lysine dipeptidyl-peptidase